MKKLLTLFILLVLAISLVACDYLPDELKDTINGILGGEPDDGGDDDHVHEFVEFETKKAFCGKDGYIKSKCSCGEIKEEVIPKLGHNIQYVGTTPPTCTKPGVIKNGCTRCSKEENEEIPALGHDMSEFTVATPPTCTEKGLDISSCSRCTATETRETEALGHEFTEAVVTTEPTIGKYGVKTGYCTRCSETTTAAPGV